MMTTAVATTHSQQGEDKAFDAVLESLGYVFIDRLSNRASKGKLPSFGRLRST